MSDKYHSFDEGFECGRACARHAEGTEPHNNLLAMRDNVKDFEWHALFDEELPEGTCWEWLGEILIGDECDREKLLSFWKWAVGAENLPKLDNPGFIKGFADGARYDWSSFYIKGVSGQP